MPGPRRWGETGEEVLRLHAPAPLPPGPRGRPVIGVLRALQADRLGFFADAARESGGVTSMPVGPRRIVLVTHPEGVRQASAASCASRTTGSSPSSTSPSSCLSRNTGG